MAPAIVRAAVKPSAMMQLTTREGPVLSLVYYQLRFHMKIGHETWRAKIVVVGHVQMAYYICLQGQSSHSSIKPWSGRIFNPSILCSLDSLDKIVPADRIDRRISTFGSVCSSPQNIGISFTSIWPSRTGDWNSQEWRKNTYFRQSTQ